MASRTRIFLHLSVIFILHLHHFSAAQDAVKGGYWFPASEFQVSNIDSSLFTHLFCAFADLDSQTNELIISSENLAAFSNFTSIVQLKNPSVKTLLSIGGGSVASSTFAAMASQASSRKSFIDSSIQVARRYGFHGLDLDWEHQSMASEMTDMGLLLDEWRAAINTESTNSGSTPLILTAALAYTPQTNSVDYPIQTLSSTLDWINAMAYDFSSPNRSDVTRSHAALYDPSGQASASYGIEAWIEAGMSAKKLVLGFPFYGYAWRLVDPANHGLFAPANGPDQSIGYVQDGSIGYDQINGFISEKVATKVHNSTIVSDYCYAGTTWIGYDDTVTISDKVKYAKEKELLGYFAWHVGADDNWALSQQAFQTWDA